MVQCKQYTLDDKYFFKYQFDSLNSFLNYIENTPVCEKNRGKKLSSTKDDFSFTKTSSLTEAINLCRNGCDENFDRFLKIKNDVSKTLIKQIKKSVIYKDVVGFVPSVSDFLAGSPFNMWNKTSAPFNNVIDIYFQVSYSALSSSSQIYNRGAITLSIIDALEKSGYAVNLFAIELSYAPFFEKHDKYFDYSVSIFKLKDCSQYLNEKIIFFPLCHPSFLRRCIFRLNEITPFNADWIYEGYGKVTSSVSRIRELLDLDENCIVISTPDELNIRGNDIYNDLENMLNSLNLNEFFKRE